MKKFNFKHAALASLAMLAVFATSTVDSFAKDKKPICDYKKTGEARVYHHDMDKATDTEQDCKQWCIDNGYEFAKFVPITNPIRESNPEDTSKFLGLEK